MGRIPHRGSQRDLRAAPRWGLGMTELYSSLVKTAVSIPNPVFEAADRAAARRGISRSELYAQALRELLARDDAEDVTARLDAIHGDPTAPPPVDATLLEAGAETLADSEW